jgi:hypothetical protein
MKKKETIGFSVEGEMSDGENGDNGNGQKKVGSGQKDKGEHKREDTKGKPQVTVITKTAKVKVLYWNVIAGLRKKKKKIFGTT